MKLKDLLNQKRVVQAEIAEHQEELRALEILINRQRQREGLPPEGSHQFTSADSNGSGERQRRVRGTLKAAKQALAMIDHDEFTRADLFAKIEEIKPDLTGKIRPEAQRSTIRTLIEDGYMKPTEGTENGEVLYRSLEKV